MDAEKIRAECLRAAVDLIVGAESFFETFDETAANTLRLARVFEGYVISGDEKIGIAAIDNAPDAAPMMTETDADFRRRIQHAAGPSTIHRDRIATDTGAALDEVGGFYGLERKRGAV